jgi:hypothetical protein
LETVPLTLVKLRDGRLVPYDKEWVSAQMTAAAQAVGMSDPLWPTEVAEAVTLFLRRRTTIGVPTEEQVEDAVVKILLRTGHVDMAKAYVLYRSQRRLEEDQVFDAHLAPHQLDLLETNQESILVRDLSGELFPWSRRARVSAIVINSGLDPSIAEQLTLEVERMLRDAGVVPAPLPLILFLHALKLLELGVGSPSEIDPVAVPAQLVRSLLDQGLVEDRSPAGAVETSGGYIVGQYAVSNVYPKPVRYAHYNGALQIRSPHLVNRFLSACWCPELGEGGGLESSPPERWLGLMGAPDRLAPYFARIELPRFDLVLARLGAGSGVVDLDVATLLGLRFWSASTERLVVGLRAEPGAGSELGGATDLSACTLAVARLAGRLGRRVELAVELGEAPDGELVGELVKVSDDTPLRFTKVRGSAPGDGGSLRGPSASRVAVNLRRVSTAGADGADQVGVEVIEHALEAARVKSEFLKSVAKKRSSGVLGGLVSDLGYDWIDAASRAAELEFYGLDAAVFELTGGWPSQDGNSAELLGRLAGKLVRAARECAERSGLTLTIHARVDPKLEGFFGMLDRTVLGLPEPPTQPMFSVSGDARCPFRGPYFPAWPQGVGVEVRATSDVETALSCVKSALNAGAASVLFERGG